jgi:hypothetical protein
MIGVTIVTEMEGTDGTGQTGVEKGTGIPGATGTTTGIPGATGTTTTTVAMATAVADGTAGMERKFVVGAESDTPRVAPAPAPAAGRVEVTMMRCGHALCQGLVRARSSGLETGCRLTPRTAEQGHIPRDIRSITERFDVERQLDRGTFGTVFACFDRKHRERVAVKVIRRVRRYVEDAEVRALSGHGTVRCRARTCA